MDTLHFTPRHLTRPPTSGIDVTTKLRHFAIITYAIAPEKLLPHLHPRFEPDCITDKHGNRRALISVVPFLDVDFHFERLPWLTFTFGQTNYRAYVIDRETGERFVWFFGTCLDSWTNVVPRVLWRLPWHRGQIRFDCEYDQREGRYRRYEMRTKSAWAKASLTLADSGESPQTLAGFPTLESGLVVLTHPLRGYYYRRDGKLGSYHIWHDRLNLSVGSCENARFALLKSLDLVPFAEQNRPHSVLIQHETEFTIYLPPQAADK